MTRRFRYLYEGNKYFGCDPIAKKERIKEENENLGVPDVLLFAAMQAAGSQLFGQREILGGSHLYNDE